VNLIPLSVNASEHATNFGDHSALDVECSAFDLFA
jgi:hypothetical protein